jgi:hypothetical protein
MRKALLMTSVLAVCGFTAQATYGQNYVTAQPTSKGFVCVAAANGGNSCLTLNQLVLKQSSSQPLPYSANAYPTSMGSISLGQQPADNLVQVASLGLDFTPNSNGKKQFQLNRETLKQIATADPYLSLALFNLEKLQASELDPVGQIMFIPGEMSTAWMIALIDSQQSFEEFYTHKPFKVNIDQYQTPIVYYYQITDFSDQSGVQLNISKVRTGQ